MDRGDIIIAANGHKSLGGPYNGFSVHDLIMSFVVALSFAQCAGKKQKR